MGGPLTDGAEFAQVLALNTGSPLASELKAPGCGVGVGAVGADRVSGRPRGSPG